MKLESLIGVIKNLQKKDPEWESYCNWVKKNIKNKEIKEVLECH